jgi:hypothetical protein
LTYVDFEQETSVGSARLRAFVWPGMILAGLALAAVVFAAWPQPTTQIVRLPYGEAQPKGPVLAQAEPRQIPAARQVSARTPAAAATEETEAEPDRVLAAVEPSSVTEEFSPSDGPAPVQSQTELDEDYVQESPEELGAEPLPGHDLTPSQPVVE